MVHFKNSNVHLYCGWFDWNKWQLYSHDCLTDEEKKRAAKFVRTDDQQKWLFARAMLRRVLSSYLSCAPLDMTFEINSHGKPFVRDSDVKFNLSHAGDCVLIGVTLQYDIGVDIEKARENKNILALSKRFFSSSEYLAIQAAENPQAAFYRGWTRKEAFIKATGLGLSFGLSNFEVDVSDCADNASSLISVQGDAEAAKQWCVRSIAFSDIEQNYFAAFAVKKDVLTIISDFFVIEDLLNFIQK